MTNFHGDKSVCHPNTENLDIDKGKSCFQLTLSEYQMREHGIVVDSVASKHYTAQGVPGTQTLYASDVVRCPLVDRGGLMGITLYPVEDGDEDRYEIFDITSD